MNQREKIIKQKRKILPKQKLFCLHCNPKKNKDHC